MTRPIVLSSATLRDAVRALEASRRFIVAVVDPAGLLLGVISDGDVRRALLAGRSLDSPAIEAMTSQPITASALSSDHEILDLMAARGVAAVPVVDASGRYVRVAQARDLTLDVALASGGEGYDAAVIMAGGEGMRLRPLTLDRPKPMIDIAGAPLLERQVRAIVKSGLKRIYIATNYLGHVIEDHFGNGKGFGAQISYLREKTRLGTAGALSLLPERPKRPILVINGDVLTTSDFGNLLSFHEETKASITISAMIYRVEIPFGVLNVDGHNAIGIEEKPSQSYLCNAGIYVLQPQALDLVPRDTLINMTDVIAAAIKRDLAVSVFPIHEYWTDIGSPLDLERALAEFSEVAP